MTRASILSWVSVEVTKVKILNQPRFELDQCKAWFPYGRKRVVTVVEIGLQSISMTVTTHLQHVYDHMETRLKLWLLLFKRKPRRL